MLKGKKTYLTAAAVGLITYLQYSGKITAEMGQTVLGGLVSIGLICARKGALKDDKILK